MTHDFHAHGWQARITGLRRATLLALLLALLALVGCATGRSMQDTVSGWFHRDTPETPAASQAPAKAPAKRKAQAPAVEAGAPEAPPAETATGAASEPAAEGEAPATPEEAKQPEPSIFDPY